jgi:hypothetical protein
MALNVTYLKKTINEVIVKLEGSADNSTLAFADFAGGRDALTAGGTPKVNIVGITATGLLNSQATITRNGVVVASISPQFAPNLNLKAESISDSVQNDKAINVAISGAAAQVYLTLRKVDGYSPTSETATYGAYDNETVVGS